CVVLSGLGVPVLNQIQVAEVAFQTEAQGARGGDVTIIENTTLGACAVTVPTSSGQTAAEIAQAVEDAFQPPGIPGPHAQCPAERNPRDIRLDGDRVVSVFSAALHVCIDDPGVGVTIGPEELLKSHPAASAGPDQTIACTDASGAPVVLDGSDSSDPDSTPGT